MFSALIGKANDVKAHRVLLIVLALVAVGSTVLLMPSAEERVTILIRDRKIEAATDVLSGLVAAGDRRPMILHQLADMLEEQGRIQEAVEIIDLIVASDTTNSDAWQRSFAALQFLGRKEQFYRRLSEFIEAVPTEENLKFALGHFRLQGDLIGTVKVAALLEANHQLDFGERAQLGAQLAQMGKVAEALSVLRRIDDREPIENDEGRGLLFDVLLMNGYHEEASRRSLRWLRHWRTDGLVHGFAEKLAKVAPARTVAEFVVAAGQGRPRLVFDASSRAAESGDLDTAVLILDTWVRSAQHPSPADLRGYVLAAESIGGGAHVIRAFADLLATPRSELPSSARIALAKAIAERFGFAALAPFYPSLQGDAAAQPMFFAELASALGDRIGAARSLRAVSLNDSDPARSRAWATLARGVLATNEVNRRLSDQAWERNDRLKRMANASVRTETLH